MNTKQFDEISDYLDEMALYYDIGERVEFKADYFRLPFTEFCDKWGISTPEPHSKDCMGCADYGYEHGPGEVWDD